MVRNVVYAGEHAHVPEAGRYPLRGMLHDQLEQLHTDGALVEELLGRAGVDGERGNTRRGRCLDDD